jgi:hypothetical protein
MPICISSINSNNKNNNSNYHNYYSFQEMTDLLYNLEASNSEIIKINSYGKTHENRDIWLVKISDNVEIDEKEPGILLIGGTHGDEKISFELLIFFIKYMIENYSTPNMDNDNDGLTNEDTFDGIDNDNDGLIDEDPSEDRVREAIDNTEIYLIPMLNPDGVEANNRKNCNPDPELGVNINRNYGYDWKYYDLFPGKYGDIWAKTPSSGNYRGPYGYSEIETQAVVTLVESTTINISLSYHSGAEVVFYPWYHTTAKVPIEDLFIEIGEAMGQISGYPLWTGTDSIVPRFGGTLGTSENYLYGEHKIIAYTVESHRIKAPTSSRSVYETCYKNVGVHLYLCEKSREIDNEKAINSRYFQNPFIKIFNLINQFINRFI